MSEDRLNEFIAACLPPMNAHRAGDLGKANAMLKSEPGLANASVVTSALMGDTEAVSRALSADGSVAQRKYAPQDWPLLLYVCFSLFYRDKLEQRSDFHAIVRLLLTAGADADAYFMLGDEKETALYGATGVANDAVMGAILLDAGADVNDEDASYHIAEHDTCEAIELLFSRGMDHELRATTLLHKLDYDDLEGVRTILDLGADPNGRGGWGKTPLHQAIMRGRSLPFLELLIERGADVNALRDDGKSAYVLASRIGRQDAVDLLSTHGADTSIPPTDEFLSACAFGDVDRVEKLTREHPGLVASMSDEDHLALVEASRDGRTDAVRMMLEAGMNIGARGVCGGTALHWAAWHGQLETVELLISRGAPIDLQCTSYKNSALGWCAYGSHACQHPGGDYVGVAKCLLASGATIEPHMYIDGNAQIVEILKAEAERRGQDNR